LEYEDKTLGVTVSSVEGATGAIDIIPGDGIASVTKTGDSEITIEAEVTQALLDAVDAKTGKIGTKAVDESNIGDDKILVYKSASDQVEYEDKPLPGIRDHGDLMGKGDDDHPQYHNDARGDARYHTKEVLASTATGEGMALIGVEDAAGNFTHNRGEDVLAELHDMIEAKAGVQTLQGGDGDLNFVPGAGMDSIQRSGQDISFNAEVTQTEFNAHDADPDAHHNESHTIESHDTTATGAELNTLTNGPDSNADSLHTHPSLGSNLFSFQVTIPGQVSGGRQVAQTSRIMSNVVFIAIEEHILHRMSMSISIQHIIVRPMVSEVTIPR